MNDSDEFESTTMRSRHNGYDRGLMIEPVQSANKSSRFDSIKSELDVYIAHM